MSRKVPYYPTFSWRRRGCYSVACHDFRVHFLFHFSSNFRRTWSRWRIVNLGKFYHGIKLIVITPVNTIYDNVILIRLPENDDFQFQFICSSFNFFQQFKNAVRLSHFVSSLSLVITKSGYGPAECGFHDFKCFELNLTFVSC